MNSTKTNIAIIIGNGKSREAIDLDKLVGQGTIFGCNALYRNFDGWDYLVAIDDRMINEIMTTEKKLPGQVIFPPEDERWEPSEYSPTMRRRSNAGMNAMFEAIRSGHNILYCLGFDFILEGEDSLGNVYKDSKNYEPNTQSNLEDNYYRIKYLDWVAGKQSTTKFVFVIPDNAKTKSFNSPNIIGMNISTFSEKLNS